MKALNEPRKKTGKQFSQTERERQVKEALHKKKLEEDTFESLSDKRVIKSSE